MLTLVACRYLPFVVCGLLMLLEVAALWLWRLGLNTSNKFVMNRNVEMKPSSDDLKNALLQFPLMLLSHQQTNKLLLMMAMILMITMTMKMIRKLKSRETVNTV
jgi:hypothetical protein